MLASNRAPLQGPALVGSPDHAGTLVEHPGPDRHDQELRIRRSLKQRSAGCEQSRPTYARAPGGGPARVQGALVPIARNYHIHMGCSRVTRLAAGPSVVTGGFCPVCSAGHGGCQPLLDRAMASSSCGPVALSAQDLYRPRRGDEVECPVVRGVVGHELSDEIRVCLELSAENLWTVRRMAELPAGRAVWGKWLGDDCGGDFGRHADAQQKIPHVVVGCGGIQNLAAERGRSVSVPCLLHALPVQTGERLGRALTRTVWYFASVRLIPPQNMDCGMK